MPYIPPDYLDNTPNRVLAEHLRRIILDWEQRHLDIASGFFDPAIWKSLNGALPLLESLRLLIGKEPELEGMGGNGSLDLQKYYRRKMQGELEALPYNPVYAEMVDGLLAFLRRESVQARLYPSFLHAKAYIFQQLAIVGSSNFTEAGLHRKAELNLVRKEETAARALRETWFEPFWNESADYKPDLIAALEDSKFGATAYSPFDVFIKALYEYFKDRLTADTPEAYIGVNLAGFQQEGLREAIRLLDRHRGVMVADAVGLGKTYVGMGLLEHYLLWKRRRGHIPRGLVVCPAQLRDLVWEPKLDEYGIKAQVLSMEELGRADFDWKAYSKYDLVLVDESHNFRNPGTGRYQNLSRLIGTGDREKYVILMTATPINNSIWDLYHQMMLLTRGSESYYRDQGIGNLKGFFQRVADDTAELFDLLEQSAVRRSRYDVKKRIEAGEKVTLPGKGDIRFPERRLKAINYDLERTYKGFYEEIALQIESLNLVSYNIESFKTQADQREIERNNALIGIIKTTFLKRLESSLRAFEVSVERQRKFQRRFFDLLQEGRLLDSPSHRKILALEDEGEDVAAEELIASLPEVSAQEYDIASIRECLEADIQALEDMLGWAKIIREEAGDVYGQDAKLAEFKSHLAGDLKGQKILVFTYYEDTARYLHEKLLADATWLEAAGNPRLGLISGKTDPRGRETIVRRFAPLSNIGVDPSTGEPDRRELERLRAEEIQILISTDVLSEGQNLQDAGVLINYDLHWNPVRMIQRAGRIDRLGTAFETLSIYNCFPEKGLESLLRLVERLQQRIRDIDRTVGLDASVLGEIIHPKSLEELKRIKAGENQVMDELERASELLSADEMKLPLVMYLQAVGAEKLGEIPLGIHSVKRTSTPGLFFAFRARDRHFWRFYPADGSAPISDVRRIFRMLQCLKEEPRLTHDRPVFEDVERATNDILRDLQSLRAAQRIRPQMSGLNKKFYDALNQMSMFGEVPSELRGRLNQVLQNIALKMFERDPKLKAILSAYQANTNPNPQVLAEQLDAFFVDNELYREIIEPTLLEQIKKDDLQLVCYEIFEQG